jgi:hypothetical protein
VPVPLAEDDTGEQWFARRPMRLSGRNYGPGERIPPLVIASLPRPEALIRAGLATKG